MRRLDEEDLYLRFDTLYTATTSAVGTCEVAYLAQLEYASGHD